MAKKIKGTKEKGKDVAEIIQSTDGKDRIDAGGGDDIVFGFGGNDTLKGGDGNDILSGGADDDRLQGDAGNDGLFGDEGDDMLAGGIGQDFLDGGDGADDLDGGDDDDTLTGGSGDDRIAGGAGNDTILHTVALNSGATDSYSGGDGIDTLTLSLTAAEYAVLRPELLAYLQFLSNETNGSTTEAGSASFQFQTIGLTVSAMEVLQVHVDGVLVDPDTLPEAQTDLAEATEGADAIAVDVLANDTVADGLAKLRIVEAPEAKGSVTVNADNMIVFDAGTDFEHLGVGETETVLVGYEVVDIDGQIGRASLEITVTGTNDAPVARPVEAQTIETLSDIAPTLIEAGAETAPNAGMFYVYDHDTGTLDTVNRGTGALSIEDVAPQNGLVVYLNPNTSNWIAQATGFADGEAVAVDPASLVLSNYDGEALVYNNSLYVMDAGSDMTLSVSLEGLALPDGMADMAFSLEGVTFGAEGQGITLEIASSALTIDAAGGEVPLTISADASDADANDTLAYSVDTAGTTGRVVDNGDGTFDYFQDGAFAALATGQTTTDTFTYTVDDGNGGTSTETVTVTIEGTNDAPDAEALFATVAEDGSYVVPFTATGEGQAIANAGLFYVMDYDTGEITPIARTTGALTLSEVAPQNGIVIHINPNTGNLMIEAASFSDGVEQPVDPASILLGGYGGEAIVYQGQLYLTEPADGISVSLNSSDNQTTDGMADYELTVDGVDWAGAGQPIKVDVASVSVAVTPGGLSTVAMIEAVATDVDEGDVLTFSIDDADTLGNVVYNGDGTFTYDAGNAFDYLAYGETATDTFQYTAMDGFGGFDTETVTILIEGVNDPVIPGDFDGMVS